MWLMNAYAFYCLALFCVLFQRATVLAGQVVLSKTSGIIHKVVFIESKFVRFLSKLALSVYWAYDLIKNQRSNGNGEQEDCSPWNPPIRQ